MTALTERLQLEATLSQSLTGRDDAPRRVQMTAVNFAGNPRPFRLVQRFLRAKPLARQLSMSAFVINSASADIIRQWVQACVLTNLSISNCFNRFDRFGESSSFLSLVRGVSSPLPASSQRLHPDAGLPIPEPGTCPWPIYNCKLVKYRSLDGTCNNLYRPLIGRAFTPFSRFLTPQYGDGGFHYQLCSVYSYTYSKTGVQSLRLSRDGSPLPEARRVSFSIAESKSVPHHVNTLMLMQWGQFLDHDLTLTAISKIATDPSGQLYATYTSPECHHATSRIWRDC